MDLFTINPATGLPVAGGVGTSENPFGTRLHWWASIPDSFRGDDD